MKQKYTESTWPSKRWPNFSFKEIRCKETGECEMDPRFMDLLQAIRKDFGPMRITSGYRSPRHPIEAAKETPGEHADGVAVDVGVSGKRAYELMGILFDFGVERIGVRQEGNMRGRFIHIGMGDPSKYPQPQIWSY